MTVPNHPKRSGFTLIEILVVMAIIGTLSAIGFKVFFNIQESAKVKATTVLLGEISAAMESRTQDINSKQRGDLGLAGLYPDGSGGEDSTKNLVFFINADYDGNGRVDLNCQTAMTKLVSNDKTKTKYVDSKGRIIDAWGKPIQYTFPGVLNNFEEGFDLLSAGPDREFGTKDDIKL